MSEHDHDHTDPFTDEYLDQLIAENETLAEQDDTWLDADPDVAWRAEPGESRAADLRELLIKAGWEPCYHSGWEPCYHRDRARLHFNVKVDGPQAYRGQVDKVDSANLHPDAEQRVSNLIVSAHDLEMEMFWMDELPGFIRYELQIKGVKPYSCGRQSGYVNVSELETDGDSMIRLAQFLTRSKAGYNSYSYGEGLATQAIEEDQAIQLMELASPRIERIEA